MNSFVFDQRLGIKIPSLQVDWETLTRKEQQEIIHQWDILREAIPDRIKVLEEEIRVRQQKLDKEEDFMASCTLNTEISDLASIINDLNLWYRVDQEISDDKPHS